MASYKQNEYCPTCKKTVTSNKGICKTCGCKVDKGSWAVRFRVISAQGSIIEKKLSGYDKKSQAEHAYRNYMTNYIPIKDVNNNILTFNELFNNYLAHQRSRTKPATIYCIERIAIKYILPKFKNTYINRITKQDILQWQSDLNNYNLKHSYKCTIRTHFSSILNYAVKYNDLPSNPFQHVDNFRNLEHKKEMQIWSEQDFKLFFNEIDDPIFKAYFGCLYLSGCRFGEALALTWGDVNISTNTININKSITRKVIGKSFAISTPKNSSSYRTVILPKACIDLMLTIKNNHKDNEFIFYGDKPLAETTIQRRFKEYTMASGVKRIRIHDLRHSHASLLISKGENIVLVAKRLGHSDIEQTLNTYSHLMPNAQENLVDKLNFII